MRKIPLAVHAASVVISLAMITLNGFFLYYAYDLERTGCRCALDWRREFMVGSLFLFIALGIAELFGWSGNTWVSMIRGVVIIAYLIITRQFISMIDKKDCDCAETRTYNVLNVVNIVQLVVMGFILIEAFVRVGIQRSKTGKTGGKK
jgi:hypothetical protein